MLRGTGTGTGTGTGAGSGRPGRPLPATTDVVVVGAGPAGLSVAACLGRAGVPYELIERAETVAPAWRTHYDRLHLHTNRALSGLPFVPMPRSYPRYPPRVQVVEYLDDYVRANGIEPHLGVEVEAIRPDEGTWQTETSRGPIRSDYVVVATGYNGAPVRPSWPGLEKFPGPVVHSSEYRSGSPFRGQDVLVVGFGNSGGEIALDLVEHGARPTVSIRGKVNVLPRDIAGIPVLGIAIMQSWLPPRLADALNWPILKLYYPSYRRLGLEKSPYGPLTQIARTGKVPLLDIGTIREIRRGTIRVGTSVQGFEGRTVTFTDGIRRDVDAVILATGFDPAVPPMVGVDRGATDERGVPVSSGTETAPGLYFCGFHVAPTGMFREMGVEARRIAESIVGRTRRS